MIVGVDLGKTGCRALSDTGASAEAVGSPGLAEPDGVEAALVSVRTVLADLPATDLTAVAVGAAGAEAAPAARIELVRALATDHPGVEVAVTSDSVTAHAGALGGRPGAVLAAGTGTVALAVRADGQRRQFDGWGPWLGDDGGGSWIGRHALRAVLLHREGRGPATCLTAAAEERYGDLATLPRTLAAGATARLTAAFVPDVLAAATAGDDVARAVLESAGECWLELGLSAVHASGEGVLAVVGGLTAAVNPTWPDDVEVIAPLGTPVHGALLLAGRSDLPHEGAVVRVPG
ncbi:BadF/BadG/BcrA/BcrD ATPase family protein [Alteromonas gracilis]